MPHDFLRRRPTRPGGGTGNARGTDRFTIVSSPDRERWEAFVVAHPKGSIFHTPAMVDVFRLAKDHCPLVLAALDSAGEILALLVAVRVQTLPGPLGTLAARSLLYAEPLCREDSDGADALAALLAEHDAIMHARVLFAEVRPLAAPGAEKTALDRNGFEFAGYLNYRTDLRQSTEELWRRLSRGTRQRIQNGERRGLGFSEATTAEGAGILYRLLRAGYGRARIPLADSSLFTEAVRLLGPRGMIGILVGDYRGVPVAASTVLLFKQTAYAWYTGTERLDGLAPAECMTWHKIRWGKERGCWLYDFGGAGWEGEPYGVRDFKAKFGGELVNHGRYRKIYSHWRFALAEKAYGVGRQVVNPQNWSRR